MQSSTAQKKRSTFLTLAAVALAGLLSACGGGSESFGTVQQDNNAVIFPSVNPLNKYRGTYFLDKDCRVNSTGSQLYSGRNEQVVFSASDKPNMLNVTDTYFYYQSSEGKPCGTKIGSSTNYGVLIYSGTLPSVKFSNPTRQHLQADKFQLIFTHVINEGVYGDRFDELSDFDNNIKGLIAQDGNTVYFGDYDYVDAEGFPTKLDENVFLNRQ